MRKQSLVNSSGIPHLATRRRGAATTCPGNGPQRLVVVPTFQEQDQREAVRALHLRA